ncbi:hypothetical protein EDD22DRAFT_955139 [Suillus occidentalis]|nr:hypothetical protein EDD22DRAFT_955139 [Suillus occidentalis]
MGKFKDIEMDILPVGMQLRKVNQSTLDAKCALVLRPHACADSHEDAGYIIDDRVQVLPRSVIAIVFIRNIRSIYHTCHTYSDKDHPKLKKEHHCSDWVTSLVHPHQTIPKASEFLSTGPSYYKLCPSQTIQDLLRNQGTHFAHDPDSSTFIGNIVAKRGQPSPMSEQEHEHGVRAMKIRKLSTRAGRMAISGLVGDYGRSYAESENDDQDTAVEAGTTEDDMYSTGPLSADEGEGPALDCATVLELIKQAHSAADCDSEAVDWDDDCDEDVAE